MWQGSVYASDFEYASVLNIAGFWIYQGYEYAGVLNMLLVLNMSGSGSDSSQTSRITLSDVLFDIIFGYIKLYNPESRY